MQHNVLDWKNRTYYCGNCGCPRCVEDDGTIAQCRECGDDEWNWFQAPDPFGEDVGPEPISVIFLDIDGVMNSVASVEMVREKRRRCPNFPGTSHITGQPSTVWSWFAPWSVEALNFITDTTGARIVISSTWRETAIPYLRRWGVRGDIIGQTPILDRWTTGGVLVATTRGEEIAAWFDKWSRVPGSRPVASFVILDDDAGMGELMPFLVQTDAARQGLTKSHARRAVEILCQNFGLRP